MKIHEYLEKYPTAYEDGGDYKDAAKNVWENILCGVESGILEMPDNMPDAGDCPRAFLAWLAICGDDPE